MRLPKSEVENLRFIKVLSLLRHKQIDPASATDGPYILKTFREVGVDQGIEYHIYIKTENEFIKQARHAIKTKAKASAIILLFTAVEHVTNHYVRVFAELRGLSRAAIDDMLYGSSHTDKITWLASLLGFSLPTGLLAQIAGLRSVRNKVVHSRQSPYIARVADEVEGSWDAVQRSIRSLKFRSLSNIPGRLRDHLEFAFQRAHPDFPIAYTVMHTLHSELQKAY